MFVNGDLKGKFIMDRNLGARDTNHPTSGVGNILYPFGRKDPFAGSASGLKTTAFLGRGEHGDDDIWSISSIPGPVSIHYAVNNPMQWIAMVSANSNWSDEVSSESIFWHDFEQDVENNGKSIFDPSPRGWKVPPLGTMEKFAERMEAYVSVGNMGNNYPLADDKYAYYPSIYVRLSTTGSLVPQAGLGDYWLSTPSDKENSYLFQINGTSVTEYKSHGRAYGMAVRAVQHYE